MSDSYSEVDRKIRAEHEYLDNIDRHESAVLDQTLEATESRISANDFEQAQTVRAASFDPSTPHGQDLLIDALNGVHDDLIDKPTFTAFVRDFACFQKDVVRSDGEVEHDAWVCVWWTIDGKSYSTASALTIKQWSNICKAKGKGPWPEGLEVIFSPNPSKRKGGSPWVSVTRPVHTKTD